MVSSNHGKENIALVAIDEAHCIEDWLLFFSFKLTGVEILEKYFSKINGLRAVTNAPFMALWH